MSKKWSQFDPFSALLGAEEIVGLQGGANKRGALNGVFKTYFDSLYWPLGGAADLSAAVTIDGNDFDLIFGSPSSLDEFSVFVNNGFHVHYDDSTYHGHMAIAADSYEISLDDGISTALIGLTSTSLQFAQTSGLPDFVGIFVTDTDMSLGYFVSGQVNSLSADANNIALNSDDGVDSSSLSLTPTQINSFLPDGGLYNLEIGSALTTDWYNLNIGNGIAILQVWDSSGNVSEMEINSSTGDIFISSQTGDVDVNSNNGEINLSSALGVRIPSFTVATLPSAATAGRIIYVSDETGGAVLAFSDGTNWRRVTDRAIVA